MKIQHKAVAVALSVALSMAVAEAPAQAQWRNPYTGTTWNNPMSSYLDTVNLGNQRMADLMIQNSMDRRRLERRLKERRGKSTASPAKRSAPRRSKTTGDRPRSAAPATSPTVAPVEDPFPSAARATSFKFTGSSLMSPKLAQMLIPKAQERPDAAKVFGLCLQKGRAYLRSSTSANLPADNVARALAFSLTTLHALALSRVGEEMGQSVPIPTSAQSDALRTQAALALSSDSRFRAQTNRQKQEAFEMLVITTVFAETAYSAGLQKNNAEMQEAARGMARDALQELLGVGPEKMRFTEAGLQF